MTEFVFKFLIMSAALTMAVMAWRLRHARMGGFHKPMTLAFSGVTSVALAKFIDLCAILGRTFELATPTLLYYADVAAMSIVVVAMMVFVGSFWFWIQSGRQLMSQADDAVVRNVRLKTGLQDRGLALASVPAILYRTTGSLTDTTRNDEFLNDKIEEILGYSREELESDPEKMMSVMHPDDRGDYAIAIGRLSKEQPRLVLEHRFRHKNGEYRWIRRHITRVEDEDGEFAQLIGCAFDVTDLKDAEARLRNYLDAAPDAVITVDADGLIVLASARAVELFGYSKEELLGQPFTLLIPEEFGRQRSLRAADATHSGINLDALNSSEISGLRKDGSRFPVEVTVSRIEIRQSHHMAIAIRDISRRKETEAKLLQAQKMEAVGQLTGGIAHDFNNMLTVIIGNLQMLEGVVRDRPESDFLGAAMRASECASELTNRLLAFSRRQLLAPKVIKVNELVGGIETLLHRTLGEDICLDIKLGEGLWPARIDPAQLENALVNLAINARDALEPGGSLIIETTNATLDEHYAARNQGVTPGDYVQVAITDTGAGIPKGVLPRIFDPFFTTKELGKGTGLGLSMVYGFVRQSHGHVKAYSEEGKGTSIKLYFPRSTAADDQPAKAAPRMNRSLKGSERILVVEDNDAVRETVGNILTSLDYRVLQARSGPGAIELLGDDPDVDLLFTDLIMPGGMTGAELADSLRERIPSLKVLYTSGYTSAALLQNKLLKLGDVVLSKPYQRATLARTIRETLDRS